ncbi:hypothetical protein JG687_00010975 [Phytophthora cactorum]|uniref:Uncharacterized protein n=1 Tax=Phytophthora cactorum TaxID=29920 RepID=A0A8T1U5H1_9STRA|nr:hypothetical protein JG687_00010975 [Phytophthora cactorum]
MNLFVCDFVDFSRLSVAQDLSLSILTLTQTLACSRRLHIDRSAECASEHPSLEILCAKPR